MYEPAIAALRKGVELWPGSTPLAWLGEVYAVAGRDDEAKQILEQLQELSKQRYVTPHGVARIYNTLDKSREALQWLETAYQERAGWTVLLKVRFQALMRMMNFPP